MEHLLHHHLHEHFLHHVILRSLCCPRTSWIGATWLCCWLPLCIMLMALNKDVFITFSPKHDSIALCSAHVFCIFFMPNISSPAKTTPTHARRMKALILI